MESFVVAPASARDLEKLTSSAGRLSCGPAPAAILLTAWLGMCFLFGRERTRRLHAEQRALHDSLTGLANRGLFFELVDLGLRRCRRTGTCGALLVLDLDDFKLVNDTRGHQCGDQVLRAVARHLKGAVRDIDTVARLGGDEFAVLLDGPADQAAVDEVSDKLCQAVKYRSAAGDSATVTVSVGTAVFDGSSTADGAVAEADLGLYADKRRRARRENSLARFAEQE